MPDHQLLVCDAVHCIYGSLSVCGVCVCVVIWPVFEKSAFVHDMGSVWYRCLCP